MCQSIAEGGRRCPLHQHYSNALLKAARITSDLSERQLEVLLRELRREGRGTEVTAGLKRAAHAAVKRAVRAADNNAVALAAYEAGRSAREETDGATLYAQIRLAERAAERGRNLTERFTRMAWARGYTPEAMRRLYDRVAAGVHIEADGETLDERFDVEMQAKLRERNLPHDPASVIAWRAIDELGMADREQEQYVETEYMYNKPGIEGMGWEDGRLAIEVYDHGWRTLYYHNVPKDVYDRINSKADWERLIKGKPAYQYESARQAEEMGHRIRCAACGRFRSEWHSCPQLALAAQLEKDGVDPDEIDRRLRENIQDLGEAHNVFTNTQNLSEELLRDIGRRDDIRLVTDAEGDTYVRVQHPEYSDYQAMYTYTHQFMEYAQLPTDLIPQGDEVPSVEDIRKLMRHAELLKKTDMITTPERIIDIREVLRQHDLDVPVTWHFRGYIDRAWTTPEERAASTNWNDAHDADGVVEGSVVFGTVGEDGDPTAAVVRKTHLKCNCEIYQRNYDCEHVRAVTEQAHVLLRSRYHENSDLADAPISLNKVLGRYSAEIDFDQQYANTDGAQRTRERRAARAISEADTREGAVAAIRAERLAAAERERVAAERRAQQKLAAERREREFSENLTGYRDNLVAKWKDIERPYGEEPNSFYDTFKAARSRKRHGQEVIPFRTENVTDGACADVPGARRFGVELEFEIKPGKNRYEALKKIGAALYAAGLTPDPEQQGYHSAADEGYAMWSFEEDSTVDGELVSPIMADTPEHWEQLRQAVQIINDNGGIATNATGSHVHVSTGSYESSTAKHVELLRTVRDHSDTIYRLATNPKKGQHRGTEWCAPNVRDDAQDIAETETGMGSLFYEHSDHNVGLNFEGTFNDTLAHGNVEFRMWDATLDPAVIQQQIVMSVALTDYAERQVLTDKQSRRRQRKSNIKLGSTRKAETKVLAEKGQKSHTPETFNQVNGHVADFLDKVLRRREDRDAMTALFAVTKWQKTEKKLNPDEYW